MNNFGFVNLIKPTGVTSSDMVVAVKKILNERHVGHLGTLDPAASGVLPIAVGRATKFFDYFLKKDKAYVARVNFGVETDTLDSFGVVKQTIEKSISLSDIEKVIPKFIGKISQVPPKFSAKKVNGKRAYELSRENIDFELLPREIQIYSLKIVKQLGENRFLFKCHCSAGTYIRTLFSDIAKSLQTVSTTEAIIRIKSGNFLSKDAVTIEEFKQNPSLISIEELFEDFPFLVVDEKTAKKLINGVKISAKELNIQENCEFFVKFNDLLIGFYHAKNGTVSSLVYLYENKK